MEEKAFLQFKLNKLKSEIRELEETLAEIDWDKRAKEYLMLIKSQHRRDVNQIEGKQAENLSLHSEVSSKASNFTIEKFSRELRVNPSEFYVYDCWLQGATSNVRFELKFVETVQGSGDECGNTSEARVKTTMLKDDPESLSEWLADYAERGDIPGIVNGIVEFSNLAKMRRAILHSLYKRSESGQLGSRSIQIQSIEDKGVLVTAIGSNGNSVFSILWKVSFCQATESMMPSFDVEFNAQGFNGDALDIFESLQKPFIKENLLPELWEAITEALISYSE